MPPELKPNSTASGWTVTGQTEGPGYDRFGKVVPGVTVSFQTNRGILGTVFVARTEYNPANVRAAIMGYVQQLHEVQDQTG